MLGLVVVAMLVGYNVYKYDANPVVLLGQYAEGLYKWHFWSTIAGQVLFALCSIIFFLSIFAEKNENDRKLAVKVWLFSMRTGLIALVAGLASILGSALLVRALSNHPTEFSQVSVNLLFTIGLMYAVTFWENVINLNRNMPKKDS